MQKWGLTTMIILGIHDSHDSGAAIIKDGEIIAAVNEERLNRIKLCWGFPEKAIKEVMRISDIKKHEIDHIAVATKYGVFFGEARPFEITTLILNKERNIISLLSPFLGSFFRTSSWKKIQKIIIATCSNKRKKETTIHK